MKTSLAYYGGYMFKLNRLFIIAALFTCFIAQAGILDAFAEIVGQETVDKFIEEVGKDGAKRVALTFQECITQAGRPTTSEYLQTAMHHGGDIVTNVKNMISGAWSFVPEACRDTSDVIAGGTRVINNSTAWISERPRLCFVLGAAAVGSTLYYGVPWLYKRLRGPHYYRRVRQQGHQFAGNIRGWLW